MHATFNHTVTDQEFTHKRERDRYGGTAEQKDGRQHNELNHYNCDGPRDVVEMSAVVEDVFSLNIN